MFDKMAVICPDFYWLDFRFHLKSGPFATQPLFSHLESRLVWISDPLFTGNIQNLNSLQPFQYAKSPTGRITMLDYYRTRYGVSLRDPGQPILISQPTSAERRRFPEQTPHKLIPGMKTVLF